MRVLNEKSIEKYRNIFSILGVVLVFTFSVLEGAESYGVGDIFVLLLPLGLSSLVWNQNRFNGIMSEKGSVLSNSKFTYAQFSIFGLSLIIFLDIGLGIALCRFYC